MKQNKLIIGLVIVAFILFLNSHTQSQTISVEGCTWRDNPGPVRCDKLIDPDCNGVSRAEVGNLISRWVGGHTSLRDSLGEAIQAWTTEKQITISNVNNGPDYVSLEYEVNAYTSVFARYYDNGYHCEATITTPNISSGGDPNEEDPINYPITLEVGYYEKGQLIVTDSRVLNG